MMCVYNVHARKHNMLDKNNLMEMLRSVYDEPISEETAWSSFERFRHYIADGDKDTIDYFLSFVGQDDRELLKLRNSLAETGYELTPSEMSQYIFILTLSLFDSIDNKNLL